MKPSFDIRSLGGKLLLAAASLLFALLLSEGALRLFPAYRLLNMTAGPKRQAGANVWRPSPTVGYEYVPRALPEINSYGMRDREYSLEKPAGVYRIAVIGDSLTDRNRWTDLLEERLNAAGKYEVLNFAVMGYNLYQYWAEMRQKVMQFSPDLVVLALCLDDIPCWSYCLTVFSDARDGASYFISACPADVTTDDGIRQREKYFRATLGISPWWYCHSALYRFFVTNVYLGLARPRDGGLGENPPVRMLAEMKAMAGGRLVAVVFPFMKPQKDYERNERGLYEATRTALKYASIDYLDLHPAFNAYGEGIFRLRANPEDTKHFNLEADKAVAGAVRPWLLQQAAQRRTNE